MKRFLAASLIAAALAACTQYALLEPKRTTVGGVFSVDPQIAWSKSSSGHNEVWTGDGPLLEEVRFITGVTEGDTLFTRPGLAAPEDWPKLKKQKRPNEVMELFVDSLVATKANDVRTDNLQPATLGPFPGFRFDYSYNRDGLDYRGEVVGATVDGKLNLILHVGTRLHYFDKYRDTFEKIVASIRKA